MTVYEAPTGGFVDLEEQLGEAFEAFLSALRGGEPVVVTVDDRDLQGNGEPAGAALAHGLLGLVRALAIEGRKEGWRISLLATTPEVSAGERQRWLDFLGEGAGAPGSLTRLGGGELGRVPT